MDRRLAHHWLRRIRPIKTGYLFAACLVSAVVCIFALRDNYVTMTRLRSAVYAADQQNTDVEGALQRLRAFVGAHMNTSLATSDGVYPPIQLTHTYQRLVDAEENRVATVNPDLYTEAQHSCESQYPKSFSGGPRVPCIEQYVLSHGTSVKPIPQDMYKFDFASPKWSPDVAGWTLALSILLLGLTVIRFGLGYILKRLT